MQYSGAVDHPGPAAAGGQTLPTIASPSGARDLLVEFIRAGARHLVLAPIPPSPSVQWLAAEIVEPVIAAVAQRLLSGLPVLRACSTI
jgi:hypothetical protein